MRAFSSKKGPRLLVLLLNPVKYSIKIYTCRSKTVKLFMFLNKILFSSPTGGRIIKEVLRWGSGVVIDVQDKRGLEIYRHFCGKFHLLHTSNYPHNFNLDQR